MISVIIPVRNEEKNLKEFLPLIKKLNKPQDYELIIVDGCSSDKTVNVAKKYGAKVFAQKGKLGVANAKNIGLKNAKSNIVLFLEADHRIKDRNIFKKLERKFKDLKLDAATVFIWPIRSNFLSKIISVESDITHYSKDPRPTCTLSMFKKSVLKKVGGYDENLGYGEDQELAERIRKNFKKIGIIKDSGLYFKQITSWKRLFRQGLWYGRNFIDYLKKTKNFIKLFWILVNVFSIPFLILFILAQNLLYGILVCIVYLPIVSYSLKAFVITKNPYSFLLPLVKVVRSYGEVIGILFGIFRKHKGR